MVRLSLRSGQSKANKLSINYLLYQFNYFSVSNLLVPQWMTQSSTMIILEINCQSLIK